MGAVAMTASGNIAGQSVIARLLVTVSEGAGGFSRV